MQRSEAREARFNEMYEQHFEVVRRYVWRRDPLIADDVAADTFLVAWRRLDGVPVDAVPWLIGVARNIRLNERRRARRQDAVSSRLAREPTSSTGGTDAITSELIEAALMSIPERDREILLLSVWEDLDRAAIAVALGCSKANVSVRLHRARRRFTEELDRQAPADSSPLHPATLTGGSDA